MRMNLSAYLAKNPHCVEYNGQVKSTAAAAAAAAKSVVTVDLPKHPQEKLSPQLPKAADGSSPRTPVSRSTCVW